jgi:hypothetical protein
VHLVRSASNQGRQLTQTLHPVLLLVVPMPLVLTVIMFGIGQYAARDRALKQSTDNRLTEPIRHLLGTYTRGG